MYVCILLALCIYVWTHARIRVHVNNIVFVMHAHAQLFEARICSNNIMNANEEFAVYNIMRHVYEILNT